MKLNDCTKDELIQIIKSHIPEFELLCALAHVQTERNNREFEKARELYKQATEHSKAYSAFLEKYDGVKIDDIPCEELKKANEHLKTMKELDAKATKIIKEAREKICRRKNG